MDTVVKGIAFQIPGHIAAKKLQGYTQEGPQHVPSWVQQHTGQRMHLQLSHGRYSVLQLETTMWCAVGGPPIGTTFHCKTV